MAEWLNLGDGRRIRLHSEEEDARITAAALADPDCPPMTEEDFERVKHRSFWWRDRFTDPRSPEYKGEAVSIPANEESVWAFRKTGDGWEARLVRALADWLRTHSPMDA
jgi:uncharacterized protein (DUF4415 family)